MYSTAIGPDDVVVRSIAELAHVTHPVGDPGGGEVGVEHLVIVGGLGLEAADLLRAAVVAGMRIDRDDRDAVRRGAGQHDGAAPAEAADLDDLVARDASTAAASYSRCAWSADSQPSTPSIVVEQLVERCAGSCDVHPEPNTDDPDQSEHLQTRSGAKISSGAAPWPCSRINM